MSKKLITGASIVLTICFLILGMLFKGAAAKQQGVQASAGIILNGQYVETAEGAIGANEEKYEVFNTGGTIFYILAGITGVICVVTILKGRKS